MRPGGVRLRVHIAPVESEIQRVIEPMKVLHADVGLLLTSPHTGPSEDPIPTIMQQLQENHITSNLVECNVWDSSDVVNEIGSIVTSATRHEYFFNVSTGPRSASIAGIIAGMFWGVLAYYVPVNESENRLARGNDLSVSGPPKFIPTFEVPVLEKSALNVLEILASKGTLFSKQDLLRNLTKSRVIAPRLKEKVSPQALHGQLDSILNKLNSWGFIELSGRGKNLRVGITERGIEGRKMFFHILNPKAPLDILK